MCSLRRVFFLWVASAQTCGGYGGFNAVLPSTIGKTAVTTPWRGGLQVHLEDMENGQVGQVGHGQSSVLPMDSPRLDAMSPPRSARRFSRSQERWVLNGFFRCRVQQDTTSESTNLLDVYSPSYGGYDFKSHEQFHLWGKMGHFKLSHCRRWPMYSEWATQATLRCPNARDVLQTKGRCPTVQ